MKNRISRYLKKSTYLGLFLTLMSVQEFYAQQVTGRVTDETSQGVPGVNVLKKGTSSGVSTDLDGKFTIAAKEGDVLLVSFIGYNPQSIKVGKSSTINVKLAPDVASLEEVVVIGYGTAKKKDVTGAVSQVTAKSFADQPVVRVEDALQGRASGVMVSKSSGAPGGEIKVRVRGVNSITGSNDPLVVIDGLIGGDLSSLNPNDIASMDVLKDASATAVYGVRGSNGVIVITTKKGSGKGKINVDYFTSIATIPKYLPTLADNVGDFARIENARRGTAFFTAADITAIEAQGGTNYQKEILRTGISKNLQISASGSEGKLRYFISGNYNNVEGIIINTNAEKFAARSNVEAQVNDKLKVGLNLFVNRFQNHNNFETFGSDQGSLIYKALTWDPTTPVYNANGEYNLRSTRSVASLNQNPVYTLDNSDFQQVQDLLNATFNLSYNISKDFTYSLVLGSAINNNSAQNYFVENNNNIPSAGFDTNKFTSYQMSNILTWHKEFGKHDLKITGVQEYNNSKNYINSFSGLNISLPKGYYFNQFADASSKKYASNFAQQELQSFMLRGEYIFNNNLSVTVTTRRDASSVFAKDNRVGYFPSAAVGYSLDEFLPKESFVHALKLRLGWGQVGNQNIGAYATDTRYNNVSYSFDGTTASPGIFLLNYGNKDLNWETTTQSNFGVDLGFQDRRGNLSVDVYKKNTTDLLLNNPLSGLDGGGGAGGSARGFITNNVGEVSNKGIDVNLGYDIFKNDDFTWNSNVSVSYVKNKVEKLSDGRTKIDGTFVAPGGQSRVLNVIELGQSLGQLYGATFLGTWKTEDVIPVSKTTGTPAGVPGQAKYVLDDNNNVAFGAIGNGTPKMFLGWNNSITYKNWNCNIFVQSVSGFDIYNMTQAGINGGAGDSRSFMSAEQVNQWTAANQTNVPTNSIFSNSSKFLENGNFIRLSNLNIGYTFKDVAGFKNTSLKVYASGQNLFLFTKYSGYDPENTTTRSTQGTSDVTAGINAGAFPTPRTYTLGLKFQL
ncbi:hypothetical protein FFWV33_18545 [Flavobacterium faecale]|uniref:SusC/RagA family TonB-linked outer membrane protein n=1 Tax=Flavobacterium faecale TaxID=1355330 RepID=A0A2S1LIS6_9FLAO|nr:SusC/RagA family TonB-linked outer membrane protein [Flavobacterium faecale]AWG23386.1 hypothetical protein FFWV33_18545 [Flavobacterium faecale]